MGVLPALDVFILAWSCEYIKNLGTFKVQINLDIDCKPKLNLLLKTMLKFPNKHMSRILGQGGAFMASNQNGIMYLLEEKSQLSTHQTEWLLGSFCCFTICPVEKRTDGAAPFFTQILLLFSWAAFKGNLTAVLPCHTKIFSVLLQKDHLTVVG